ncbi:MAG: helix-turn-helix transcriptional regulator [Lentisphaeria bacterium]|nr:helix-turn-helix transcriptional regulator [Lentisphaeria bacterium]
MSNSFNLRIEIVGGRYCTGIPRWNFSHVSVPTWRFYWNPEPGAWIRSRGVTTKLVPEIAVLIPPNTPFSTGSVKPFDHLFAHFTLPEGCQAVENRVTILDAREILPPGIAGRLETFSGNQLRAALCAVVYAAFSLLPEDFVVYGRAVPDFSLFRRATKLLDGDPACASSCTELAAKCGTTVSTLHRQFIKAAGVPVRTWLLNRRMENASRMLLYENLSIKETADRLGYADRYHFSKVFKKYFGTSPALFRRSGGLPLP